MARKLRADNILSAPTPYRAANLTPPPRVETARAPRPEKLERVIYSIPAKHRKAIISEAAKRMAERGSGKINASEVLCEFLEDCLEKWLARR
jgi:hypothetical protein